VVSKERGVKIEKAALSLPDYAFFCFCPPSIYPTFLLFFKPPCLFEGSRPWSEKSVSFDVSYSECSSSQRGDYLDVKEKQRIFL
jgi:hypothetical protein